MRWFVRGDVDGFFGLALDNLVQLLLIVGLCGGVLGFSADLIYGHVLPGVCVSLLVGNLFYAWQAREVAFLERRTDICALPYGINTVSLIAHVFLVMLPAKLNAVSAGAPAEQASVIAWQTGLVACFGSGLIEFSGAFFARYLRQITPRAALLSTLSGIALGFIAMSFLFRMFARPIIGLTTLAVVLITYFGGVRFKIGLPGGFIAVALGTGLAWATGVAPSADVIVESPQFRIPVPVIGDLMQGLERGAFLQYLSVIVPMGLFNLIGSLQNLESAEAAGDRYSVAPSLATNGLGSIAACIFGSCFPTTIYIGHPGWKAMGARTGYSILNAVFFTIVCLGGLLSAIAWAIPVDAGMAIVLYIGIVITAQAFQATPREHAPAVVVGLLPGVAAWGVLMATQALQVAGVGSPDGPAFDGKLVPFFQQRDTFIDGAFALAQGFIFSSMILAAATVAIIGKRFQQAGIWCLAAAVLSGLGMMHSYTYTPGGPAMAMLQPAWPFVIGYSVMAVFLFITPYVTEPGEGH